MAATIRPRRHRRPLPGGSAGNTSEGFEGSLATTGLYAGTWTVTPETVLNPFNAYTRVTLAANPQTFGNLGVGTDGAVSFGTAAAEFGSDPTFNGTGAKVTLDSPGRLACAFTIDSDVVSTQSTRTLHMSGGLTVHRRPEGVGGMNCP